MNIVNNLHDRFIYNRRISRLSCLLTSIIRRRKCKEILDVGAGDGKLDALLHMNTNVPISGIDVVPYKKTYSSVKLYDGVHIDEPNNSKDTVMMIDVLHHTKNPKKVFQEVVRISSKYIIIKDHIKHGLISYMKLRFMDYAGNKHNNVNLPYNYLTTEQWQNLFDDFNLDVVNYKDNLNLYTGINHMLFDSNLHFIVVLKKRGC